jgi:membrane-bound lytic murein transglycosylase B
MQFMPATFNSYALDGDGNGTRDITDVDDAIFTAGRYLAAGGANSGNYNDALYHYNHSATYVSQVRGIAARLGL